MKQCKLVNAMLCMVLMFIVVRYAAKVVYAVELSPGTHIEWYDRLANLPQYAQKFNSWLLESTDGDGIKDAMIDPTMAARLEYDGNVLYVYEITSFKFDVDYNVSGKDVDAAIMSEAKEQIENNFDTVMAYIRAVYDAFDRDHPEVFWLNGKTMLGNSIEYTYRGSSSGTASFIQNIYFYIKDNDFDVRADKYQDVDTISLQIANRNSMVATILAGVSPDADTYTKVAYFNKWLTENNCYNSSSDLNSIAHDCRECISALGGSSGAAGPVCEGYSRAFKVLCDAAGINCTLANGYSYSDNTDNTPENHMWSCVEDNGKWYAVDVTWNDPLVNGINSVVSGCEREDYLMVGSETMIDGMQFGKSHVTVNVLSENGTAFTNQPVLETGSYSESAITSSDDITLYDQQILDEMLLGYSMSLDGNMNVKFYFKCNEYLAANQNVYIMFTLPNGTNKKIFVKDALRDETMDAYIFTCEIAAREMSGEIKAQMFMEDGIKGNEYTYSVKQYAEYIINNADTYGADVVNLAVAMLNYGANAQMYFETADKDKPANEMLTEAQKNDGIAAVLNDYNMLNDYIIENAPDDTIGIFTMARLEMESELALEVYFKPADGISIDSLIFTCNDELISPDAAAGEEYLLKIDDVKVYKPDAVYIFEVKCAEKTFTWVYSPMIFCYNVLSDNTGATSKELKSLVAALYCYWDKAYQYAVNQ